MNHKEFLDSDFIITYGGKEIGRLKGKDFPNPNNLVFEDETITGRVMDIISYAKNVAEEDAEEMWGLISEIEHDGYSAADTVECWYHPMGAWNVHKV